MPNVRRLLYSYAMRAMPSRCGLRVTAGVLLLAWSGGGCGAGDAARGLEYTPPAHVDRPAASVVTGGDGIGLVRAFDLAGDTLFLLERTGRVVVLERGGTGWRVRNSFGREGGGPGEFLRPTSLAVSGGRLVVADATRLQFFTSAGELVASKRLALPCPMALPGVAAARDGLFVHGNCYRRGYATDTLKAMLFWTRDTVNYTPVAEDVRYTKDGTVGHVFTAWNGFTGGAAGRHLFGSGATNCIWRVEDVSGAPAASQLCPAALTLYADDPPPGVVAQLKEPVAGMRVTWPPHLTVYVERATVDDDIVLIRPFSTDSVLLQLLAPREHVLAVAPLDGLIGCRPAGCVWLFEEEPTRVMVLDTEYLRRRIAAAPGQ